MGFRPGAWATCWEVTPKSNTMTSVRLSISYKNKETGEYDQDFADYVTFIGTANAAKAAKLIRRERIKLGDIDVSKRYDEKTKTTYTNFKCFSFETSDEVHGGGDPPDAIHKTDLDDLIDDGTLGEPSGEDDLPF